MERELWGPEEYDFEAQRLYDAGELDEALDLLREGLLCFPDAPALLLTLGYTHLARETYGWARAAFAEVLDADPEHEEALVGLGDALLKLGERSRAFLAFDRVRELGFDEDPELMLAIARALYREGLYERAADYYRRAGEHTEATAELGYCFYRMGRRRAAARQLVRALQIDPQLYEARLFHGNLLYEEGDYEAALDAYLRVPPGSMTDPLAAWRTVELLRGLRGLPSDDRGLEPYIEQLERLSRDPTPEERLLERVRADVLGEDESVAGGRQQLDLFAAGAGGAPRAREPEVHTVRARDGRVFTGDWISIVGAMRDQSVDPSITIAEFMRETARMLSHLTGIRVPHDDPEAFLRASARAGVLQIEA